MSSLVQKSGSDVYQVIRSVNVEGVNLSKQKLTNLLNMISMIKFKTKLTSGKTFGYLTRLNITGQVPALINNILKQILWTV